MPAYELLRWAHVTCMVGLLGGLLVYQIGLSTAARADAATLRSATRLWNILLGLGLLLGALMYGKVNGHTLGGHFNGVVGFKFLVLLAVGGLLPVARRGGARADGIRRICILLLLAASFSAFTLR